MAERNSFASVECEYLEKESSSNIYGHSLLHLRYAVSFIVLQNYGTCSQALRKAYG